MSELRWNWLAAPYVACVLTLLACALVAALVRGDRVMRLGVIGAALTTLPWAFCTALSICAVDRETALRFLRIGSGPVGLIGPNLLLVLLGVSGQLERHRWLARIAGLVGVAAVAVCWGTDLVVPDVQLLRVGIYYTTAGPLTDLHWSQLLIWMGVGMWVMRRAPTSGEKRRISRLLVGVLAFGAVGSIDTLLIHGVWDFYPLAWISALSGSLIALYLVLYTDLLRPQGFDRYVFREAIAFFVAAAIVAVLAWVLHGAAPLALAISGSMVWVLALGAVWVLSQQPIVRVAGSLALEQFVAALADVDDERVVVQRLAALWAPKGIELKAAWRVEEGALVNIVDGTRWPLDKKVAVWLVEQSQAVSPSDLATMRLGELRPQLEALTAAHGATLLVPLIDRGELVGLVEADHGDALREDERALVAESARAVARALTYAALARTASKERANAREVEVAEAMRLQAVASRDDELGRWTVAAEYRSAPKTTGAGWAAALLADGRLALMVTETKADGVPAALATAALTGAFHAATTGEKPIELDDLLKSLEATDEGIVRGGEAIRAFIAVLDADTQRLAWACAGHPGAFTVGPIADLAMFPTGSMSGPRPKTEELGATARGESLLAHDHLLVVASRAVRGEDEERWRTSLIDQATAGPRLAQVLVDQAQKRGDLHEDFLAVVVRQRPDRTSKPVLSPIR